MDIRALSAIGEQKGGIKKVNDSCKSKPSTKGGIKKVNDSCKSKPSTKGGKRVPNKKVKDSKHKVADGGGAGYSLSLLPYESVVKVKRLKSFDKDDYKEEITFEAVLSGFDTQFSYKGYGESFTCEDFGYMCSHVDGCVVKGSASYVGAHFDEIDEESFANDLSRALTDNEFGGDYVFGRGWVHEELDSTISYSNINIDTYDLYFTLDLTLDAPELASDVNDCYEMYQEYLNDEIEDSRKGKKLHAKKVKDAEDEIKSYYGIDAYDFDVEYERIWKNGTSSEIYEFYQENDLSLSFDDFVNLCESRRAEVGRNFGWEIPDDVMNYFYDTTEGDYSFPLQPGSVEFEWAEPMSIVDNIAVNGEYYEIDEFKDDDDLNGLSDEEFEEYLDDKGYSVYGDYVIVRL